MTPLRSSPVPRASRRPEVLACPAEERFDRVTRLARRAFGVQAAAFLLHDGPRAWIRSSSGLAPEAPIDDAFPRQVLRFGEALVVDDASRDARLSHTPDVAGRARFRFFAGVPVRSPKGDPLGTFCVFDPRPRLFAVGDLDILRDLALLLEDLLRASDGRDHFELLRDRPALRGRALVDPATRAWTREAILELARLECDLARRERRPVGLLAVELADGRMGEAVLREAAVRMKSVLREYDALGRLDEAEFLAVLPGAWQRQADELGEKLKSAVEARPVETAKGRAALAVAVGAAAGKDRPFDELIAEADRARRRRALRAG